MNPALGRFLTMDSWGGIITDPITLHKYLYADCDPVNKIDPSGQYSILGVMTAITITATIASIAIPIITGIYLAIVNKVSVLDYLSALCSEDVWIEAAISVGLGAVVGLGIKAIAKKLACEVVAFIGVIMSLWSLYQSINLSIEMVNGGMSREQVARYLAVLTATVILTTIIGKICFAEDTLIKTDDGYKEIKDIEVGDLVYSEDPLTGEKGLKRVTNVFVNETSVIVRVYVGDEEIETTPTHPFWVIGKGWVAAGDIEAGDKVYLYSGEGREVKEVRFEYLDTPIKVYNFEVEDWHTYFVSEQDVFVHNTCGDKDAFPDNPDDLLPEIPRDKVTKSNGTTSQTIYTSDSVRIRAEQHPLLQGEVYNPRHHGVHYHVEFRVDTSKSWNNKNNVIKFYPGGYVKGSGTGFLPGEIFPGL